MDIPLLLGPYMRADCGLHRTLRADHSGRAAGLHHWCRHSADLQCEEWPAKPVGRASLERASAVVPRDREVELILGALDGSACLVETAASSQLSWGVQIFSGANVFADAAVAQGFQTAVAYIPGNAAGAMPVEEASP